MDYNQSANNVLHWNYRGFTEFPLQRIQGEESDITDIYLKENLISRIPNDIGKLYNLQSLYLSGNDITELPRDISKLKCLKCLDISGNRLRHIPGEIGELKCLKFLILDENELRELPLRLADLRELRYLSVCDNQLEWISQRPVYNYYHCELRFWRNPKLKTLPYSLWYHMFRGQQTRSLNIGSLNIPRFTNKLHKGRCLLRICQDNRENYVDINFPANCSTIIGNYISIPPNLLELCKRKLYELISAAAKNLSNDRYRIFSDYNDNIVQNLEEKFNNCNINKGLDVNSNLTATPSTESRNLNFPINKRKYYVTSDLVKDYFYYLPAFIKDDLYNGPVSRCENVLCKKPVFDYAFFEFCLEKVTLIDNTSDVILSATFCSKTCADAWKIGKCVLPWSLAE